MCPDERKTPGISPRPRDKYVGSVRQSDVEPYTALRWVGTLFKAAAVFLAVAIVGEFIAGLRLGGTAAHPGSASATRARVRLTGLRLRPPRATARAAGGRCRSGPRRSSR